MKIIPIPKTLLFFVFFLSPVLVQATDNTPSETDPIRTEADGKDVDNPSGSSENKSTDEVSGGLYIHQMQYSQKGESERNRRYLDTDGDGIADLAQKGEDKKSVGAAETVGKDIKKEKNRPKFIDEDGDGFQDNTPRGVKVNNTKVSERRMDNFTDNDGDGINDGRGFERERRTLSKQDIDKEKNISSAGESTNISKDSKNSPTTNTKGGTGNETRGTVPKGKIGRFL